MGRARRVSTYLQAPLKRAKNIHTRRTKAAIIHRDATKLSSAKTNKRLK